MSPQYKIIALFRKNLLTRAVAVIVAVTFLVQDILWASPESFRKNSNNINLAPAPFEERHASDVVGREFLAARLGLSSSLGITKIGLAGLRYLLLRHNDSHPTETKINFSEENRILTVTLNDSLILRYCESELSLKQWPRPAGFAVHHEEQLKSLFEQTLTKEHVVTTVPAPAPGTEVQSYNRGYTDTTSDDYLANAIIMGHIRDGIAVEVDYKNDKAFTINPDGTKIENAEIERVYSTCIFDMVTMAKTPKELRKLIDDSPNLRNLSDAEKVGLVEAAQKIAVCSVLDRSFIGENDKGRILFHVTNGSSVHLNLQTPAIWIGGDLLSRLSIKDTSLLLLEASLHLARPQQLSDSGWAGLHPGEGVNGDTAAAIIHDNNFLDHLYDITVPNDPFAGVYMHDLSNDLNISGFCDVILAEMGDTPSEDIQEDLKLIAEYEKICKSLRETILAYLNKSGTLAMTLDVIEQGINKLETITDNIHTRINNGGYRWSAEALKLTRMLSEKTDLILLPSLKSAASYWDWSMSKVDVGKVVTAGATAVKSSALELSIDIDPRLSRMIDTYTYKLILYHAVKELTRNAEKNYSGATRLDIRADLTNNGDVEVTLRDNGKGISADGQEKIFKERGYSTAGKTQGTGFGLYDLKMVIESVGGTIAFKNNKSDRDPEATGASFTFTLPVKPAPYLTYFPTMKEKIVVAVSGLRGSGRKVISNWLASKLGLRHIEGGLLVRAIMHEMLKKSGSLGKNLKDWNEADLVALMKDLFAYKIADTDKKKFDYSRQVLYVDGKDTKEPGPDGLSLRDIIRNEIDKKMDENNIKYNFELMNHIFAKEGVKKVLADFLEEVADNLKKNSGYNGIIISGTEPIENDGIINIMLDASTEVRASRSNTRASIIRRLDHSTGRTDFVKRYKNLSANSHGEGVEVINTETINAKTMRRALHEVAMRFHLEDDAKIYLKMLGFPEYIFYVDNDIPQDPSRQGPFAGSIANVFDKLCEWGATSPESALSLVEIAKRLARSPETIKYDVRALYYHLHLIEKADEQRSGKLARYYVPENVKKKAGEVSPLLREQFVGVKYLRPRVQFIRSFVDNNPIIRNLASESKAGRAFTRYAAACRNEISIIEKCIANNAPAENISKSIERIVSFINSNFQDPDIKIVRDNLSDLRDNLNSILGFTEDFPDEVPESKLNSSLNEMKNSLAELEKLKGARRLMELDFARVKSGIFSAERVLSRSPEEVMVSRALIRFISLSRVELRAMRRDSENGKMGKIDQYVLNIYDHFKQAFGSQDFDQFRRDGFAVDVIGDAALNNIYPLRLFTPAQLSKDRVNKAVEAAENALKNLENLIEERKILEASSAVISSGFLDASRLVDGPQEAVSSGTVSVDTQHEILESPLFQVFIHDTNTEVINIAGYCGILEDCDDLAEGLPKLVAEFRRIVGEISGAFRRYRERTINLKDAVDIAKTEGSVLKRSIKLAGEIYDKYGQYSDDAETNENAAALMRCVSRLSDVLENMDCYLDTSMSDVEIGSVIDKVSAKLSEAGYKVAIDRKFKNDLKVHSYRGLLEMAIKELIFNAVKYGDAAEKGVELTISVSGDGSIDVNVKDHGPGISGEILPNLFITAGPKVMADPKKGTGFGLYYLKSAIRSVGGKMSVESVAGKGSSFSLTLPASRPTEPQPAMAAFRNVRPSIPTGSMLAVFDYLCKGDEGITSKEKAVSAADIAKGLGVMPETLRNDLRILTDNFHLVNKVNPSTAFNDSLYYITDTVFKRRKAIFPILVVFRGQLIRLKLDDTPFLDNFYSEHIEPILESADDDVIESAGSSSYAGPVSLQGLIRSSSMHELKNELTRIMLMLSVVAQTNPSSNREPLQSCSAIIKSLKEPIDRYSDDTNRNVEQLLSLFGSARAALLDATAKIYHYTLSSQYKNDENMQLLLKYLYQLMDTLNTEPDYMDKEMVAADIEKTVRETVLGANEARMLSRDINIKYDFTKLPRLPYELYIYNKLLKMVLREILQNASRYSKTDTNEIAVSTTQYGELRIDVEDHGVGIPEENRNKIFERWFTTGANIGGSGIGLNSLKSAIESVGGEIWFRSEVGQGTCFSFTLPVKASIQDVPRCRLNKAIAAVVSGLKGSNKEVVTVTLGAHLGLLPVDTGFIARIILHEMLLAKNAGGQSLDFNKADDVSVFVKNFLDSNRLDPYSHPALYLDGVDVDDRNNSRGRSLRDVIKEDIYDNRDNTDLLHKIFSYEGAKSIVEEYFVKLNEDVQSRGKYNGIIFSRTDPITKPGYLNLMLQSPSDVRAIMSDTAPDEIRRLDGMTGKGDMLEMYPDVMTIAIVNISRNTMIDALRMIIEQLPDAVDRTNWQGRIEQIDDETKRRLLPAVAEPFDVRFPPSPVASRGTEPAGVRTLAAAESPDDGASIESLEVKSATALTKFASRCRNLMKLFYGYSDAEIKSKIEEDLRALSAYIEEKAGDPNLKGLKGAIKRSTQNLDMIRLLCITQTYTRQKMLKSLDDMEKALQKLEMIMADGMLIETYLPREELERIAAKAFTTFADNCAEELRQMEGFIISKSGKEILASIDRVGACIDKDLGVGEFRDLRDAVKYALMDHLHAVGLKIRAGEEYDRVLTSMLSNIVIVLDELKEFAKHGKILQAGKYRTRDFHFDISSLSGAITVSDSAQDAMKPEPVMVEPDPGVTTASREELEDTTGAEFDKFADDCIKELGLIRGYIGPESTMAMAEISGCVNRVSSAINKHFIGPDLKDLRDAIKDSITNLQAIPMFVDLLDSPDDELDKGTRERILGYLDQTEKNFKELNKLRKAQRLLDAKRAIVNSGALDASLVLGASAAVSELPSATRDVTAPIYEEGPRPTITIDDGDDTQKSGRDARSFVPESVKKRDSEQTPSPLNPKDWQVYVLAGGKGSRIGATPDMPKPMFEVRGRPIYSYLLDKLLALGLATTILTGFGAPALAKSIDDYYGEGRFRYIPDKQENAIKGTGNTFLYMLNEIIESSGKYILITNADDIYRNGDSIQNVMQTHSMLIDRKEADATVLAIHKRNAGDLGRIVRDDQGNFLEVVESDRFQENGQDSILVGEGTSQEKRMNKDAIRNIEEINANVIAFRKDAFIAVLDQMFRDIVEGRREEKEIKIAELLADFVKNGKSVRVADGPGEDSFFSCNEKGDLSKADEAVARWERDDPLTAIHELFGVDILKLSHGSSSKILLSESLFGDDAEVVRAQLRPLIESGSIVIHDSQELCRIARRNGQLTKSNSIMVLTKEDCDNPANWDSPDKGNIRTSLLIADGKLADSNYLYLEGIMGLARAIMAKDERSIRRYYELMSDNPVSEEAIRLLQNDDTIDFAFASILKFKPIVRLDPQEISDRISRMETFLISA